MQCQSCHCEFEPTRASTKFCSTKCRMRAYRARRRILNGLGIDVLSERLTTLRAAVAFHEEEVYQPVPKALLEECRNLIRKIGDSCEATSGYVFEVYDDLLMLSLSPSRNTKNRH